MIHFFVISQREFCYNDAMDTIKFIDLFAGIGGIRLGFEQACKKAKIKSECVFTSEIKPHAIEVLKQNHNEKIDGDITQIEAKNIPDFDVLLGGFPCQAFSAAGKRLGFEDTRGTLFFDVARILKEKKPLGFVLENVEGLKTVIETQKSFFYLTNAKYVILSIQKIKKTEKTIIEIQKHEINLTKLKYVIFSIQIKTETQSSR